MLRLTSLIAVLFFVAGPASAADGKYEIKPAKTPAPMELKEPLRKLMGEESWQLQDSKGTVLCELWFRTGLPVKAAPEQVKNGLTYRELEESSLIGAIKFDQPTTDYRKQKVKPGVYTLRLGFQPQDGDHMGTAPFPEFCLLLPAAIDEKPVTFEAKELREMSAKSIGGSHPGVMLLYPNEKPEEMPKMVDKGMDTWVLMMKYPVVVDGQKAAVGLGLTLVGHTMAE